MLPNLKGEVEKLTTYMDLNILTEPSVKNNNPNQISTGSFNGKPVFPGGFTTTSRFIRAAIYKERAIYPKNE